jgi:adenosylcobalamin-dependent ribonucleoside-triphosphate reductase
MRTHIRRFKLSDTFIDQYRDREVPWGPLGYVTFKRTYARRLNEFDENATVYKLGLEWNDQKAQRTAKDAYERLFTLKWTPPGRGLWMMGTKFVNNRTAAGLFNCAFRSTRELNTKGGYLFSWMMDALMLGIGVGFDTLGADTLTIKEPEFTNETHVIPDSREGWVDSVKMLLNGYLFGTKVPNFDYSAIRPYGAPINGFGGTSSGAGPLEELHRDLRQLYAARVGQNITSVDIVDTENLIGRCVVAGNVRRSAALALGNHEDREYLQMKNDSEKLAHHRWGSNNSFHALVGQDYTWHAEQSQKNGEPGYIWLDNARTRGRFADPPRDDDKNVMGFNPCVEQQLEDAELCCLVETFPAKHETYEDYLATLKIAYLYGKTVTLANTHWPETNAKMLKNRRIGLSQSGVVQAFNKFGRRQLMEWCDNAYEHVKELDAEYSDWLCIPKSVRTTSIKPSGTVSLLNGSTPGIHYPEDEYYIRRIRFAADSDMLPALASAGYKIEPDHYSPNTMCVEFPVHEEHFVKGKREITMWEQLEIAAQYQHYWADNSVSITVTFKPEEAADIKTALEMYETRLKAVSFLRYEETGYVQAPYEPITREQYEEMSKGITPVQRFNTEEGGAGTKFCDGESCMM